MGGQQEGICPICPICKEEMDLTDQELQPCICGYEICLWCWHFTIQTASKDGSDARCAACHSPYDKEKILKRTISKERLEILNVNKKHKLQKTKHRPADLDIDINSIRVIRRNIVYIAGIPKKISNEKTLRQKEYLGQYGKIVTIFIVQTDSSRQYHSSDSCIVYVTFSMVEEALRCIQVVNGYILDGSPLKASFGTTRYCYSWLNNFPCKNPDCLYVHEVVPQEDICSREEVISFCTSKLQRSRGLAFTNLKQHSGSFLPPPVDTKNSLPSLGLISHNRRMKSDYFVRSYATVASSHNQSKLFAMNDSVVLPSSRVKVYFPSSTVDHNAVPSLRNEMSLPKYNMGNIFHVKPCVGICHSKETFSPDYKTATEFNSALEDNSFRSSFLDGGLSKGITGEPFLFHSDGISTSPSKHQNALHSYDWSGLQSDFGSAKFNNSFEDESFSARFSRNSKDFSTFSTITTDSRSNSLSNGGPDFELSCTDKTRDEKFLNHLHSDLGSTKFSCSFSRNSKDFSTSSTIAANSYQKLNNPSISPTEPMLFHGEQKNLCRRSSSNSILDFEFTLADKTRDEKFLIESYIEHCEDKLLSDIFSLDLNAIDDPCDTHFALKQLGSSDGLSRISNTTSFPSTRHDTKSLFSLMDDLYAAIGQFSGCSNVASGLTSSSSCSAIMMKKEAYIEDSINTFYLGTPKTSKVLNSSSLVSATEVVGDHGSSLDMHHSGSSLYGSISQLPCSNSARRSFSTPPGFSPRKTNPGNTDQIQPHISFPSRNFSNTNSRFSSHTSSSMDILPSSIESWKDQFNSVSSNAVDFGVIGRNQASLTTISSFAAPELKKMRHSASYF